MLNLPRQISIFLAAVCASQLVYYYQILPQSLAIHFDANGVADNFVSKQIYLLISIGLIFFGLFFSFINNSIIKLLPHSLINMPHREYWLAKERREETFRIVKKFFDWLGAAILALFVCINQLSIEANLSAEKVLSNKFWYILGAFLIFTAIWTYKFTTRFSKTN